jgi:predicted esterase
MKTNLHLPPLLLASIAALVMRMTGYIQSPSKVPVRRRISPLRLPWPYAGMAAMVAAILMPCATIAAAPAITPTPTFNSQSVFAGVNASFTVTATGDAPLVYLWRQNGAELPGKTNGTLTITAPQPSHEGAYDVVVSNASGSVTSYISRLYAVLPTSQLVKTNDTNAARVRLPYFYHLPSDDDPARRYPLLLVFTGGGIDETSIFSTLPAQFFVHTSYARQAADPALVVYVTRRAGDGNSSWTPQYLEQVAVLLDNLLVRFNIDTDRIYVHGSSEGAHAVWDLLRLRPGLIAAAGLPAGWKGTAPAASIKDVPMRIWHAADDPVSVSGSRDLVQALRLAGGHPIYTEFQTGGHAGGIGQGDMSPVIHDWFMAQRRGAAPIGRPLVSITSPASQERIVISTTNVPLAGSAESVYQAVTRVSWENLSTGVKRDALGTESWKVAAVPLRVNATNVIVVTATTPSGFPVNGGTTTFSDTLFVHSMPITVRLDLEGSVLALSWTGGVGPYRVQKATNLMLADWQDYLTNPESPVKLDLDDSLGFYRVVEP